MPEFSSDRRQFARLQLSEDAVALDREGNQLGKVSQAGGGGFLIQADTPQAKALLKPGSALTLTVFEPGTKARSEVDVEVRYADETGVGVQFVGGKK